LHDDRSGRLQVTKAQNVREGAHTPGPWRVSADGDVYVEGDERKIVAWCAEPSTMRNACVIAAAPDMLTVLREMQRTLQHLIRGNCTPSTLIYKDLVEKVCAAIAKADGAAWQDSGKSIDASTPRLLS
jgi:hypothetical protein